MTDQSRIDEIRRETNVVLQKLDETNEQYHSDTEFVSASMLKAKRDSPRIFEGKYITKTIVQADAKHFVVGTAVHCAALEPERFADEYVACPPDCSDRRTKKHKQWKETVGDDKIILSSGEAETVTQCVAALRRKEIVRLALDAEGDIEESWRWLDQDTGVPCKMRVDKAVFGKRLILDIKTIEALDVRKFFYQCKDFGYHLQDAHYREGCSNRYGGEPEQWLFVIAAVETKPPYRCRLFQFETETRMFAGQERDFHLRDLLLRRETKDWSEQEEDEIFSIQYREAVEE